MKDETDFLPVDTHQRFLQIDTIILDVCRQTCPNYPNNKFENLQYLKKEFSDEVDFLHGDSDKHKGFLQIDTLKVLNFTGIKFHDFCSF